MGNRNDEGNVFVGTDTPWRGIGTSIEECRTGRELCDAAGIGFNVSKVPLMGVIDAESAIEIPGKVALMNDDTQEVYSIVGSEFGLVQNVDAFAVSDVLVAEGRLSYDAAGYMRSGAICWATAKLGTREISRLDGSADPVDSYLFFANAFTRKHSYRVGLTGNRLRCSNQVMATLKGLKMEFKIPHRPNIETRIAEAHALILNVDTSLDAYQSVMQGLAEKRMTTKQFRNFARKLLDEVRGTFDEETKGRRARESHDNREKLLDELTGYFGSGLGNTGESAWDGFNGVTEWLDHRLERREDGKRTADQLLEDHRRDLDSSWFGRGRRIRERALRLLTR